MNGRMDVNQEEREMDKRGRGMKHCNSPVHFLQELKNFNFQLDLYIIYSFFPKSFLSLLYSFSHYFLMSSFPTYHLLFLYLLLFLLFIFFFIPSYHNILAQFLRPFYINKYKKSQTNFIPKGVCQEMVREGKILRKRQMIEKNFELVEERK